MCVQSCDANFLSYFCHLNSYCTLMQNDRCHFYTPTYIIYLSKPSFYIQICICNFFIKRALNSYNTIMGRKLMKSPLGINRNKNTSGNTNGFEPLCKEPTLATTTKSVSMQYGYISLQWHHFSDNWNTLQPKVDSLTGVI